MPKFLSDEVGEADLGFDALGNLSTVKYPNGVQSVCRRDPSSHIKNRTIYPGQISLLLP
jgi:hypothetical protein